MATRFYFADTLVGPVTGFNGSSGWNNASSMTSLVRHLSLFKLVGGTSASRLTSEAVASVINIGIRQHLSDELGAQTISGTFSAVFSGLESVATADNSLQVIIRVMSADGGAERATLYSGHTAALNATVGALGQEFVTTAATRIIPSGTALSSYTCVDGDRLCVETGYRSHDVSATSDSATITFGHPSSTADFALTAGLTTNLCPWVELSGALVFKSPFIRHRGPNYRR